MKINSGRSLKSQNMKWLISLAIFDVLAMLFFLAPTVLSETALAQIGVGGVLTNTVIPIIVLLIINVLPHNIKSVLVYWKLRNVLPGFEAFTKYGPTDPRIDMTVLKENIGVLPTDPLQQNTKWYKLYRLVQNEPEVMEAHKLFLMYRDMAVMSLVLCMLTPVTLVFIDVPSIAPRFAAFLFLVQYLVTALSARWSGVRFVCNVLTIHCTSSFERGNLCHEIARGVKLTN